MSSKSPLALALLPALVLAACASNPPAPRQAPAPPVDLAKVYFYPTQGQSEAQQDRDRYDCYLWSVKQTGFDPTRHIPARDLRATVVPARSPGETIGTAAAVGAVIGAATARRGDSAEGAIVGAIAGSVIGAAAAGAEAEEARAIEARQNARGYGRYEREANEYRRAMSACLEGRGYSVR